jgi:hypothetical protein
MIKNFKIFENKTKFELPYGEENSINENNNSENIIILKNWKYLYGEELSDNEKTELLEYENYLNHLILGRKISFKASSVFKHSLRLNNSTYNSHKNDIITIKPVKFQMSINFRLYDDAKIRLKNGQNIYTNILEFVDYFIFTNNYSMFRLKPYAKIKFIIDKKIISDIDPYGEEKWED